MERRGTFSREFKLEAVELVTARGVTVAQCEVRPYGEAPRGLPGQSDV